jgi:diacylglycerol kinase family enzyme
MVLTSETPDGATVATLKRLNPLLAARIVGRLVTRRDLARLRAVRRWTDFGDIHVGADRAAPFQADGEHLGHARSLAMRPLPEALLVLKP